MSSVEVIIFDLGKVILDFDHRSITRRLAERSSLPEERIQSVIFDENRESLYDRGKMSSREFYVDVVKSLRMDLPFREFRDIWTRIFTPNKAVCNVVQTLKKRYRLMLLSNTNEMHFDYVLGAFEILNLFDDHILSYRVGERKPHSSIYFAALKKADCAPGSCVYIDDMEEYVWAARDLGIQAILFTSSEQLQRELRGLDVLV